MSADFLYHSYGANEAQGGGPYEAGNYGASFKDVAAIAALQGILASMSHSDSDLIERAASHPEKVAKQAWAFAEALLATRSK